MLFNFLSHIVEVLVIFDVLETLFVQSLAKVGDFMRSVLGSDLFDNGVVARFLKGGCLHGLGVLQMSRCGNVITLACSLSRLSGHLL